MEYCQNGNDLLSLINGKMYHVGKFFQGQTADIIVTDAKKKDFFPTLASACAMQPQTVYQDQLVVHHNNKSLLEYPRSL